MTPISFAGAGALVTVIEAILRFAGIEFPEGSVLAAMNGFVAIFGLILLVWGQLRRKDLHFGLVRKAD